MFKAKKTVMLSLAVIMTVLLSISITGCQKSGSDVLKVGIDDTYPPMEFKNDDGKTDGFDIDFANKIGEKLGKKIEFVPTQWSGIFLALESGKFDCIISSLSITDERKKTISFTRPYISNTQVIVLKSDNSDIESAEDLKDKIVAVQIGTTSEEACIKFNEKTPFKDFKKYDGMTEALTEIKIGRVDAVVTDLVVGKYFVAMDKNEAESKGTSPNYKLINAGLPSEPIGIGFKKDNQLAGEVDKIVGEMMDDGTLKEISEKWFGEDMTSNIE